MCDLSIRFSVLDQSPIYPGETAEVAFAHTIQVAQKAEELGFYRFWVSEHHDSEQLAGSSPEVLIAYLLAKTNRIRIGSGGVMLQHYSPYKVAENFNVLSALAPGRVDLGVGRAPGGLLRSTKALQRNVVNPLSMTDKIIELRKYLQGNPSDDEAFAGLKATPAASVPADLHILGTSVESAEIAAELGLPYVFSLFIGGDLNVALEAIRQYRERFDFTSGGQPQAILALSVIVADSDEVAQSLVTQRKLVKIHLASGRTLTVGSIAQAEAYGQQSNEPYTIEEKDAYLTVGSKDRVRWEILELQAASGVGEFIVTTNVADFGLRLRSFELLREAFSEVPAT